MSRFLHPCLGLVLTLACTHAIAGSSKKPVAALEGDICNTLLSSKEVSDDEASVPVLNPRVSVVIPTYNRAAKTVRAVNSVLAQSYRSIEIIVVDDGSTDNTSLALQSVFGDKIRYFRKTNGGVSSARNFGIAQTKGEYVAFLDSDDLWLPNKIEMQVKYLDAHESYGMVLTGYEHFENENSAPKIINRRSQIPRDGNILENILLNPSLVPSTVMVRKSALDKIGVFDESLPTAEDLEFHFRMASQFPIGLIDMPLIQFIQGPEGLSAKVRTYSDYIYVVERFLQQYGAVISLPLQTKMRFEAYLKNAKGLLGFGEYKLSLQYAVKGAKNITTPKQAWQTAKYSKAFVRSVAARAKKIVMRKGKK